MGCTLSSAKTYRPPVVPIDTLHREIPEIPLIEAQPSFNLQEELNGLTQGVSKLPKMPNIKPCVIISEEAFPAFTAPLFFSNGDETTINLPIVACSRHFNAPFILVGSFDLLLHCNSQNTDASVFFENIIHWASGKHQNDTKISMIGVSGEAATAIRKNAGNFGFRVKECDESVPKTNCLIVPTNYKNVDFVRKCLDSDIGIILCYYDLEDTSIYDEERNLYDDLLKEAGTPFALCDLKIGSPSSEYIKSVQRKTLLQMNLDSIVEEVSRIISEDKINIEDLDSTVTLLRLHCAAINNRGTQNIDRLFEVIRKFIFKVGIQNETDICPNIESKIATILASELLDKVSPLQLEGLDLSEPFPGKTGNVTLSTYRIQLNPMDRWISTGIWLPPGIKANVEFNREVQGCTIQIGSNSQSLISSSQALSWKRWPIITLNYEVYSKNIDIVSPFGGIVYFLTENITDPFEITISNVCRYPRFSFVNMQQRDEIWEQTKDIDVPFGEIETTNCIFTLPSDLIRNEDTLTIAERINSIVGLVFNFMALTEKKQLRIVYDVEIAADYQVFRNYPIFIDESAFKSLSHDRPSRDLFRIVSNAAFFALPEYFFHPEIEDLLALVVACAAIKQAYPMCNPMESIEGVPPNMFIELWDVYEKFDHHAFSEAFRNVRKYENMTTIKEGEMWEVFIQEYENIVEYDLSPLKKLECINKSSSSNMMSSRASASLHDFIVSDLEIEIMK